jgi:hypothetical protein
LAAAIRFTLLGAVICSTLEIAFCQRGGTVHASITGTRGVAIPKAGVTALRFDRGLAGTISTNQRGEHVLPFLPVGACTLSVVARGFTSSRPQQCRSSTPGMPMGSRRALETPARGRNVRGRAVLLPGASQVSAPRTFTGERNGPAGSIWGSRPAPNADLLDGGFFNALFRSLGLNYPPPGALQGVTVFTNGFGAGNSRDVGAVFNVVTRSDACRSDSQEDIYYC